MNISFRVFSPVSWVFSPVSWVFQNQNKKTANITHRAFLFTWIVHQDLIRIPQNMDKITFRLSFQFPPQADIWGQAEIQALWKIQVYIICKQTGSNPNPFRRKNTSSKSLLERKKLSKCFHKPRKVRTCKPWLRGWVASGPLNGLQLICFLYSSKASENDVLRYSRWISHATGKCRSAATATKGRVT